KLPLQEMSLDSEGIVDVTNGVITYKKIIHKPKVILQEDSSEADHKKLEKLVEKAEKSCMISRALRGNVAIELQPNLDRKTTRLDSHLEVVPSRNVPGFRRDCGCNEWRHNV